MSLYNLELLPSLFISGVAVGGLLATAIVFLTSAVLNFRKPEKSVADLLIFALMLICTGAVLKVEGLI